VSSVQQLERPPAPAPGGGGTPPAALLTVDGLRVSLGGREVLRGVSLRVAPGEIVGVIGETGSGKTTLARAILGLTPAASGSIDLDGEELTKLGHGRRRRAFRRAGQVQLVFQDPLRSLDPALRIRESVTEGLAVRGRLDAAARQAEAERALELVGLPPELLERVPGDISGGQRQRVAIARALVTHPRLIVLDEPVSALDASSRGAVLGMLRRLRDELGLALVIISHDLTSMLGVVDRVVVLYEGAVVEEGPTEQVLADPREEYTRLLIAAAPASVRARLAAPARSSAVPAREE
jgi:ABC-type glutathione transport system ATPase component